MLDATSPADEPSFSVTNILLSVSDAIDLASEDISAHQMRTAFVANRLAARAGFDEEARRTLFAAALFHDVGAITIDEKVRLRFFEETAVLPHCSRGAVVMRLVPFFAPCAPIVLHHHDPWESWRPSDDDGIALAAQIIQLADWLERWYKRDRFVLHQRDGIMFRAEELSGKEIRADLVQLLREVARHDEFWFAFATGRIYPLLANESPWNGVRTDLAGFESMSVLFKYLIDLKSPFTATHSSGVSAIAVALASLSGAREERLSEIAIAANLHDLGKLSVPNSILDKPGPMSGPEEQIMRRHPHATGATLSSIAGLERVSGWASAHHEALDGSGYARGLRGEDIPMEARIIAVADHFAALAEDRPYRAGMPMDKVIGVLREDAKRGALDAGLVETVVDSFGTLDEARREAQEGARAFYRDRFVTCA